ncbi:hypothetical protein MN116_002714 [Schistosoma mekongi]|uniref:TFIIS N-terminal domain-containing protein n=1 Tax=Schistosoma mekongi TaxID=38744 RepID=A0AAE1ZEN3_SCHME|nr:hypothetical protein MN116_002714 [Schistosoma mekongi]
MSASVVSALVKFGETLVDKSVDAHSKLRVLSTLNEVKLTLSELSESGVGRAVRKLKNEPGELGKTANTLISKWKNLLNEHIKQESIDLHEPVKPKKCAVNDTSKSHIQTLSTDKSVLVINDGKVNSAKSPQNNFKKCMQHVSPTAKDQLIPDSSNNLVHLTSNLPNGSTSFDACAYPKLNHKSPSNVTKSTSSCKRKSVEIVDSIDSSSGISFMDSLNVNANSRTHRKKKCSQNNVLNDDPQLSVNKKVDVTAFNIPLRPSEAFSAEIISSLSEPVNRPDVVNHPPTPQLTEMEDDFESGDLKFKSKKVLWVPKQHRSTLPPNNHSNSSDNFPGFFNPSSLIDLCIDVLARNINRVDHVGQVPYELLAKALRGASVDDLTRIERYNPQFIGLSDNLWCKYINRDFQHLSTIHRQSNETWCDFYNRLSKEETKRLDRIITQSARKIKEEQEMRRTTLTTEVITPRQMQRRGYRQTNYTSNCNPIPNFKPRNMSHPSPNNTSKLTHSTASTSNTNTSSSNTTYNTGGLLNKLRKQFHSGHLR